MELRQKLPFVKCTAWLEHGLSMAIFKGTHVSVAAWICPLTGNGWFSVSSSLTRKRSKFHIPQSREGNREYA